MSYISATDDTIDSEVKRYCAPLYATGQFLQGGHSDTSTNATATFVKYESRYYAVTCHHVIEAMLALAYKAPYQVNPAIHASKSVVQLATPTPRGTQQWAFVSCGELPTAAALGDKEAMAALTRRNASYPDIAIAEITSVWGTLQALRRAEAVDLDAWTPPDWGQAQPYWLAYGYPDEHKATLEAKVVAVPMPRVTVRLATSVPSEDKPTFTLHSTLEKDHGWFFSGLSGGPVLIADKALDRYAVVGITFAGTPGSRTAPVNAQAFYGPSDISITGYQLTPARFQEWLRNRRQGVEFDLNGVPTLVGVA